MTDDGRRLLEARWRLQEFADLDLHEVADGLLSAGEDADALIRLFSLDRDQLLWEGGVVFEDLFREWGGGMMSESEAVETVLLDMSRALLEERLTPEEATDRAGAIYVRTGWQYDELVEWFCLDEEFDDLKRAGLSDAGRDRASIESAVRSLARSIVKRHS